MSSNPVAHNWNESLRAFLDRRVIVMLFLGFAAGLPILLIFSSLSLWLREAGVSRSAVTYFSWAALGYSFKFVWAPLVDRLPLPLLTRWLGRRRAWMLLAQAGVISAILWMAFTNPAEGETALTFMALAAVLLGFSSATQDIVIDAYRIEAAEPDLQAMLAATYIAGYRLAMIVAGAGALFLAEALGSVADNYVYEAWRWTYMALALTMGVGVLTTLIIGEPERGRPLEANHPVREYLVFFCLFLCAVIGFVAAFYFTGPIAGSIKNTLTEIVGNKVLSGLLAQAVRLAAGIGSAYLVARVFIKLDIVNQSMVQETYIDPVKDFFSRYGLHTAWLLLALVGLYRISDIVLGVISNVFYHDMGFTKSEIGKVVKTFGVIMSIVGGFLGGLLAMKYGVLRILFLGAVLSAATNLLFMLLAQTGHNMPIFYAVIAADNLSAGLASAAFVAFLSSLTNISFTAMQYAIFSSLMTLLPKVLGGYSGSMVDSIGYPNFFLATALMGLPVLLLIWLAAKRFDLRTPEPLA